MASDSGVTLSVAGYNQIKAENTKAALLVDRLFEDAIMDSDKDGLVFDNKLLNDLLHLIYPERYKKKLSYLRGLETKNKQVNKEEKTCPKEDRQQ